MSELVNKKCQLCTKERKISVTIFKPIELYKKIYCSILCLCIHENKMQIDLEKEICEKYISGISGCDLAREYGLSNSTINGILKKNKIQARNKGDILGSLYRDKTMPKELLSEHIKGRKENFDNPNFVHGNTGKKHSEEQNLAHSERVKLHNKLHPESIEKGKITRAKWLMSPEGLAFKKKQAERALEGNTMAPPSSLEYKLKDKLLENNIEHLHQFPYDLGIADFLIYPNLVVFVDGEYWHKFPHGLPKDKVQQEYLIDQGYKVLRFWGEEILKNLDSVINKIKENI